MPHSPAPLQQAWRLAFAVASGRHALSPLVPPALWLADAALCGFVVARVACRRPRALCRAPG